MPLSSTPPQNWTHLCYALRATTLADRSAFYWNDAIRNKIKTGSNTITDIVPNYESLLNQVQGCPVAQNVVHVVSSPVMASINPHAAAAVPNDPVLGDNVPPQSALNRASSSSERPDDARVQQQQTDLIAMANSVKSVYEKLEGAVKSTLDQFKRVKYDVRNKVHQIEQALPEQVKGKRMTSAEPRRAYPSSDNEMQEEFSTIKLVPPKEQR